MKRCIESSSWNRRRIDALRSGVIRAAARLARDGAFAAKSHPLEAGLLLPLTSGTKSERLLFQQILSTLFRGLVLRLCEARGLSAEPGDDSAFLPNRSLLFLDVDGKSMGESDFPGPAKPSALDDLDYLTLDGEQELVDYATLPPETLGHLYESLLPYFPRLFQAGVEPEGIANNSLGRMKDPSRLERRMSGSYYTSPRLVDALLRSALVPALAGAFERQGLRVDLPVQGDGMLLDNAILSPHERCLAEEALLDFKVVDPACGSAAFLIAAQDLLAKELLSIRCGDDRPSQAEEREARKDVLLHNLFGVDKDPMALQLARIGLWLNAGVPDLAWEDLDENLKCGDALVGAPVKPDRNGERLTTRKASDLWTARHLLSRPQQGRGMEEELAREHRFFHWRLEFPRIFSRPQAGFDCVLANPPWERIKLQEREFFAQQEPAIAAAGKASERRSRIRALAEENPDLHRAYLARLHQSAALSRFLRSSGRYALASCGDPNTYLYFTELCRDLLSPSGSAGLIVPSGIATDKGASSLFQDLMEKGSLISLFDFVNRKRLFPEIAGPNRFCLLTIGGAGRKNKSAAFQFFCQSPEDLEKKETRFRLDRRDLALLNPNTRTCPPFIHKTAADRVKAIYSRIPVLVKEGRRGEINPWEVRFWNMFHMSSHSGLFRTKRALAQQGCFLDGNRDFSDRSARWLRLYESKLMHILNHRYNTFEGVPHVRRAGIKPGTRSVSEAQASDPSFHVEPRYWVPEEEVARRAAAAGWTRSWFLGLRSVTNVFTNRRSVVPAILPWSGVGNSASLISSQLPARKIAVLAACFSSLALDYVARMKIVGSNLNFFILKQLPVPEPRTFEKPFGQETLEDYIASRVLELCYTAQDLAPFARDMGYDGPPMVWDGARRARIRAELDAVFFMVYDMKRSDLNSIMKTFPILERKERARFEEFRFARLVNEAWDRLESRRS
ncbi:MAG: Eco57I restriction-modification methylase domain-containing protein [Planctomycetota bacterium]